MRRIWRELLFTTPKYYFSPSSFATTCFPRPCSRNTIAMTGHDTNEPTSNHQCRTECVVNTMLASRSPLLQSINTGKVSDSPPVHINTNYRKDLLSNLIEGSQVHSAVHPRNIPYRRFGVAGKSKRLSLTAATPLSADDKLWSDKMKMLFVIILRIFFFNSSKRPHKNAVTNPHTVSPSG